jgi:Tfp pilus assembly protein PilF
VTIAAERRFPDDRGQPRSHAAKFGTGLALLVLVTGLVYGQVVSFDFVDFDDYQYVTRNPAMARGITLDAVRWAFTSFYASNWHPLTWLSHLLDVQIFGMHAGGHHLVGLLIHLANTLLLAHVLLRLTGAPWRSLAVAALFALHPLHVESVAYVAERKDVLSALFWLLTMEVYGRYAERPGWRRYLLLLAVYILGLLAKPMLVTLPCVLMLLDYWPLQRLRIGALESAVARVPLPRLFLEKVPLLVLAVGSAVITYVAQQAGGSIAPVTGSSIATQIGNAVISYETYLVKTVWPFNLAVFYPFDPRTVTPARVAASLALLAGITWMCRWRARRQPYLLWGWLWFLGTLVPVIGLVRVGEQALADRYTYIPLIGIFVMLAWGVADLIARLRVDRRVAGGVVGSLFVVMAVATWHQARFWRSSFTLFEHAIEVTDDNWLAHLNLATAYMEIRAYDRAIEHLHEALRIRPNYANTYNNLGNAYFNLNNPGLAIDNYKKALSIDEDFVPARRNLVRAYLRWGYRDLAEREYVILKELSPEEAASVWH